MTKSILLMTLLVSFSAFAAATSAAGETKTVLTKLRLMPGYCGEVDPFMVGDVCVFRAFAADGTQYNIYDSAPAEDSDLATTADKHGLVAGKDCFVAEIYQTPALKEFLGEKAYQTRFLKRITCN